MESRVSVPSTQECGGEEMPRLVVIRVDAVVALGEEQGRGNEVTVKTRPDERAKAQTNIVTGRGDTSHSAAQTELDWAIASARTRCRMRQEVVGGS